MNKGLKTQGYTIVEVLIVLAVTSALLVSALLLISGRQAQTEFTQAINDVQSQINDVMNNVATGYYANQGNVGCTTSVDGPTLSSTPPPGGRGTSQDCLVIGRVIQFAVPPSSPSTFHIYDLAGLRLRHGTNEVATLLTDAKPVVIAPYVSAPAGFPNTTEILKLQYGLEAVRMRYTSGGITSNIGAAAFMSRLGATGSTGLNSGVQAIEVRPVSAAGVEFTTAPDMASTINYNLSYKTGHTGAVNSLASVADNVTICFKSGGTNQYGLITIGSNGRQLSTKLDIFNSLSEAPAGVCT